MTDETQWQSPGGTPPRAAPTPPPPVYSGSPGYAAPPPVYSAPPPFYAGPPATPFAGAPTTGWTPPPKPGLIPLRPLDLGTILGASFRVLRRNPRPTFGAALLLSGVSYLLLIGVVGLATFGALSRISSSTNSDLNEITAGSFGLIALASIIPVMLSVVASAMLQGLIVLEVSRATVGEKLTFRQLWRQARGRFGALIGWSALLSLALVLALIVLVFLIAILAATLGVAGIVASVLLGIFGGLGLLVLYAWLATKLALVPSALMIERLRLGAAVARSWSLTQGFFWRTFGIIALVAVILAFAGQVISAPLSLFAPFLQGLVDPQSQNGPTAIIVVGGLGALTVVITVAFESITSVIQAASTALVYIDLRIRREGLDLELAHFVEARQAGNTSVIDPLLHATIAAPAFQPGPDGSPWR